MKTLKHFLLNENTNQLYKEEAISSISLTRDIAEKINELVDAYNELSKTNLAKVQEQDGKIRKGIVYLKDNLVNTLHDLIELLESERYFDKTVKNYTVRLEKRIDNLLGSLVEGSTILDAEVIDGRMGFDGSIYDTLGESIREQIEMLLNRLNDNINMIINKSGKDLIENWDRVKENTTLNTSNGNIESLNGYYFLDEFLKVDSLEEHFIFQSIFH